MPIASRIYIFLVKLFPPFDYFVKYYIPFKKQLMYLSVFIGKKSKLINNLFTYFDYARANKIVINNNYR